MKAWFAKLFMKNPLTGNLFLLQATFYQVCYVWYAGPLSSEAFHREISTHLYLTINLKTVTHTLLKELSINIDK